MYIHTHTHKMFIAALCTIAKNWKQPRCCSTGEWINKLCYTHTMEYYSVIKRNELSSHGKAWRNLKCILLSERSQSEKTIYYMSPTNNIMEKVKR